MEKFVKTSITLKKEQKEFLNNNSFNSSKLFRNVVNSLMQDGSKFPLTVKGDCKSV